MTIAELYELGLPFFVVVGTVEIEIIPIGNKEVFWRYINSPIEGFCSLNNLQKQKDVLVLDWFEPEAMKAPANKTTGRGPHLCHCTKEQVLHTMEGCICNGK